MKTKINKGNKAKGSFNRREFIKAAAIVSTAIVMGRCGTKITKEEFLQKHFKTLTKSELAEIILHLETECTKKYGKRFTVSVKEPLLGTEFAYALNISKCIGCRRCVYGCVEENNLSRDPQVQWIQVLEMDIDKGIDYLHSDLYYNSDEVPTAGHFYLPVACMQCQNPPCVKTCPVIATWQEPDGITVVDYNWCIGCRCCMASCPYGARHFNWREPHVSAEDMNPNTHYLGNRPNYKNVVGKCTFCVQRVREGRYPRCVEVCPVGARKFGNLLDPASEIRYILQNTRVLILKEELNTRPRFFYFFET